MLGVLVLHWIIVGSLMHLCWIIFSIKTICTIDMCGVLVRSWIVVGTLLHQCWIVSFQLKPTYFSHDPAPMQHRSNNNNPGPNQHPTHVNIAFVLSGKPWSSTDAPTIQQRTRTEPALQTCQYYIWYKWKHDPAQMQQRSNNDPGRMQQLTTANIALT